MALMNRESEGRVKDIVEEALLDSDIAWWEWDVVGNAVSFNDLKVKMLGYDPEDFRGSGYQAFTDLLHPDDYQRTMQAMTDHLEGRSPIYQIDYRIQKKDGSYTWYMDRGVIIERDEEENPATLRGIVIDLGSTLQDGVHQQALVSLVRRKLPVSGELERVIVLCSSCRKIKLEEDTWVPVDASLEKHFGGEISHGLCPECIEALYPDLFEVA